MSPSKTSPKNVFSRVFVLNFLRLFKKVSFTSRVLRSKVKKILDLKTRKSDKIVLYMVQKLLLNIFFPVLILPLLLL